MHLLRRSTDLGGAEGTESEGAFQSNLRGKIVIVESRPKEMSQLAAILESLNFHILNVTKDSDLLRLIQDQSPLMILSSRRLPPLEEFRLLGELPETTTFVYVPKSDRPVVPDEASSLRNQVYREEGVVDVEDEVRNDQSCISTDPVKSKPASYEVDATAKEIVGGFRGSAGESELASANETQKSIEKTVETPLERDEDLTRIQRYRAEYQTRQRSPEIHSPRSLDDALEVLFEPRRKSPESGKAPLRDRQTGAEQEYTSNPIMPQRGHIPPDPEEDYSMIERIDAQEIAGLSQGNVLSEKEEEPAPRPHTNLYEEARSYVLDSIRAVDVGKIPDLVRGEAVAERIVSSVETGSELLLSVTDRRQEFAISSHSVNTAVFAVRIALALGLSRWQELRITLAGLLHEIGVVRLPKQLIYKTERPTLEEIKILRQRPIYAARSLKGVDSRYDWLSEVVGQVYERENGTGHPLGLTGREICEEAKVIGIADLFDACIHRRPYREALTGYQALFELTTDQARTFSDRIVKALIKSLSLFPYNEFVLLNSGEIGKVVEINLENLSRPVIEVLYDKEGVLVELGKPVDLAQNPTLYIAKALPYRSLPSD